MLYFNFFLIFIVIEHIDSEKKAKVFRQKPAVYTKYIFGGIIDAVTYSIQFNKNLTILCLEALPMNENYAVSIAKVLLFLTGARANHILKRSVQFSKKTK